MKWLGKSKISKPDKIKFSAQTNLNISILISEVHFLQKCVDTRWKIDELGAGNIAIPPPLLPLEPPPVRVPLLFLRKILEPELPPPLVLRKILDPELPPPLVLVLRKSLELELPPLVLVLRKNPPK